MKHFFLIIFFILIAICHVSAQEALSSKEQIILNEYMSWLNRLTLDINTQLDALRKGQKLKAYQVLSFYNLSKEGIAPKLYLIADGFAKEVQLCLEKIENSVHQKKVLTQLYKAHEAFATTIYLTYLQRNHTQDLEKPLHHAEAEVMQGLIFAKAYLGLNPTEASSPFHLEALNPIVERALKASLTVAQYNFWQAWQKLPTKKASYAQNLAYYNQVLIVEANNLIDQATQKNELMIYQPFALLYWEAEAKASEGDLAVF